jgi:hypothetical protein
VGIVKGVKIWIQKNEKLNKTDNMVIMEACITVFGADKEIEEYGELSLEVNI